MMNATNTLLDHLLPDETLNDLIRNCTCPQTLKSLLQIKYRRIEQGSCEKLNFSISCIYNEVKDSELSTEILKTTLQVAKNCDLHLTQTVSYCLKKSHSSNCNEIYYCLNLFNVVLEYYIAEKRRLVFPRDDLNQFQNAILRILNGSSKPLITFILVHIIPNFSNATDEENVFTFLSHIFNKSVKQEKKLEIVCMCYDNFIKAELNEDFNLLKSEEFWFLLMDCLTQQHHYLKRQATYLLSKTIEVVVKLPDSPVLPTFLKTNSGNGWRDYLLLLDISNEKQLHIVEPSLPLFSSILNIDFVWRSCLYKIFLNHSQNVIVYSTAVFILQNETEWEHFSKIIIEILRAVNKNDYNVHSIKVFEELGCYCNKLQNGQFQFLLSQSLSVSWIPAAIWSFYNKIFNTKNGNFQISLLLVSNIIKKLKLIPHKFIRKGCMNLMLHYFVKNSCVDSVDDLLKASLICRNFDDTLFKKLIIDHADQIRLFSDDLRARFVSDCESAENLDILCEIVQLLEMELPRTLLLNKNNTSEERTLDDIDLVENIQQVVPFLHSCQKYPEKILNKASDILEKNPNGYNVAQKFIAFDILYRNDRTRTSVIDFWNKFLNDSNRDEQLTQLFVESLLKHLDKQQMQDCITILDNLLDSQNKTTITILENLTNILQDLEKTIRFVERCFDEYLNLIKTYGSCRSTSQRFLSQMFRPDLLENEEFRKILLGFSQRLLEISNNSNSIACILSENIARLVKEDSKESAMFIPVIVDLNLYGIIVNKSERVEYHICQEIRTLPAEVNPNTDQMLTRLSALDSMLVMTNNLASNDITNKFISLLAEKYTRYFSKRYFPDSQIHLEKLRILQALILLIKHTNGENSALVEIIIESFIVETHQPSVKLLLQFLLILLMRKDSQSLIHTVCEKIKTIDNNRPSTVTGLIPVLYHLVVSQNETEWDLLVDILLPYTMGAQFKLRIYAQVGLVKLYEKAIIMKQYRFLERYEYLYKSLNDVIEATNQAAYDVSSIYREFFDFSIENCDFSTILYTIPKSRGVTKIEWQNLHTIANSIPFKFIAFGHNDHSPRTSIEKNIKKEMKYTGHIQKKVTPWKEMVNLETISYRNDFILVTTLIEKPANLGGLSRTCEVFGIKRMVMRTSKITSDKEFQSLSMSSEHWIDITEVTAENLTKFILDIKAQGFSVVGAEQTSDSVKLDQFRFSEKTVLMLGNEKKGIPADLIPLLDKCIEIPQFGLVRSLNVHVAGAIVMWEYCKQQKL